jgi:alpha-L-fucosidase
VESGIAGVTNWNRLDTAGYTRGAGGPPTDSLNAGNLEGKYWIPAECDVSIRPGWFYHQQEDAKVKSGNELFQLYLKSVGRGANLLLNVPPNNNGLISNFDSTALINFYTIRKNAFKTDLLKGMVAHISTTKKTVNQLTDANKKSFVVLKNKEFIQIHLTSPVAMNTVVLEEYLGHGQSIRKGYVQVRSQQQLDSFMFTSIGNKRIINFPKRVVEDIFIYFLDTNGPAYLASVAAYAMDEKLVGN